MSPSPNDPPPKPVALSELPIDELIRYGQELGVQLHERMGQGEMLRRVRERQELLVELDREALLDIVVWARHPVRVSASKEELARHIASIIKMDFRDLSDAGLTALACLRGVNVPPGMPRDMVEAMLKGSEPLWNRLVRTRRRVMASVIHRMVVGQTEAEQQSYQFLPEENPGLSLKRHIADEGVVGGIARKIRGVADDYVREKLDEIEKRIDQKLDEIDKRLAEWRDREISNRLRIIKITLVASIVVALLSLGYNWLNGHWASPPAPQAAPNAAPGPTGDARPCDFSDAWV